MNAFILSFATNYILNNVKQAEEMLFSHLWRYEVKFGRGKAIRHGGNPCDAARIEGDPCPTCRENT